MKIRNHILALLILTSLSLPAMSQKKKQDAKNIETEIDNILSSRYKANEPGVAALVCVKNKVIYKKAFGMANLELEVPLTADMVFRIGSISKQFTGVAILQLMEQGKLSLQDDITKYIEDFPTHGHNISIHHLLIHTSGIKSYTDMKEWTPEIRKKDFTPSELLDFFKEQPMEFAPGEKFQYNNSAYVMLGYIIEKVSGMTYAEYVEKNLFKPAGMTNSLYGNDNIIVKKRASGYDRGHSGTENAEYLSMTQPYAAGSLMSTVEDLMKWNQTLHAGKIISKESLKLAFTNYTLNDGTPTNYGYGWFLGNIKGSPVYEHGGGINGFITQGTYLPEEDIFVALFTNSTLNPPAEAATMIAALVMGKPFETATIKLSDEELKRFTGVYEKTDGTKRNIYFEEGKLVSQRGEGAFLPLIPYEKNAFYFENSLTSITFELNKDQTISQAITKSATGNPEIWKKTDLPLPERAKGIQVSEEILQTYTGDYELSPGFILSISIEDGKLWAQATGQPRLETMALTPSKFSLIIVPATIEFFKDDKGKVSKLILLQGGKEFEAPRVEKK